MNAIATKIAAEITETELRSLYTDGLVMYVTGSNWAVAEWDADRACDVALNGDDDPECATAPVEELRGMLAESLDLRFRSEASKAEELRQELHNEHIMCFGIHA